MLVFGPLADIVSVDAMMVATGAVLALLGVPFFTSRTMREAGRSKVI
jgi:hypothetical protein